MTRGRMVLAGPRNSLYLNPMVQPATSRSAMVSPPAHAWLRSAIVWGAATLGAVVLLAAGALWFHYGTTVFFEMIAAGVSACF